MSIRERIEDWIVRHLPIILWWIGLILVGVLMSYFRP